MKDAVITVRLPRAARRRLEELARREGRSLSAQVERLLDGALAAGPASEAVGRGRSRRRLAGLFAGSRTPTLKDFAAVRKLLSESFGRRTRSDDEPRR